MLQCWVLTLCWAVLVLSSYNVRGQASCDDSTPCEDGHSCHPTKNLCYPDPPELDRPSVFLGKYNWPFIYL